MTAPLNSSRTPPYKVAGLVMVSVLLVIVALVFLQFRGKFEPKTELTLMSERAGLVMDPGSKVTYNGVVIGRVANVTEVNVNNTSKAKLTLNVNPKYIHLIPQNVDAKIQATTVFGNKYVSFTSPKNPVKKRVSEGDVIQVSSVTTEFNTLFETLVSISEKVDPIKLNETLSAAAQALDGLGDRFGQSIIHGNEILDDVNPRLPQVRYDNQRLADLAEIYADASPDLWAFLRNAVITARTFNEQQANLDAALTASVGFGNTGADVFERGGPYLTRGAEDLIPTSRSTRRVQPGAVVHPPRYP